ncbi:hypothetical protein FRC19_003595 [Serendipita sp. 401]|nr:hypothetical protein FRC19_003595 [Serendipita sp. 401]
MIRQSLSAVLNQCERLIALTIWAGCMPPASDPMKEMVDDALEAHSLCRLKTITYLAPGEKEFDDSATQEVVTF